MKNILVLALTVIASVSFAQTKNAAPVKKSATYSREYGLAGYGLGSVLIGKHGSQIFAGTTNGTSGNQTFGISSGTLNCVDSASSKVAGRMDQFILVNRAQVQGDVARGNGETIAALSVYMGCDTSSNEVAAELKNNYQTIFTGDLPVNEITDTIIGVILSKPTLAEKCTNLS